MKLLKKLTVVSLLLLETTYNLSPLYSSEPWTLPAAISTDVYPLEYCYPCYNPATQTIIVTSILLNGQMIPVPYFTTFSLLDGWSTPATISASPGLSKGNPFCCYYPDYEKIITLWAANSDNKIVFSTYSSGTLNSAWSEPVIIDNLAESSTTVSCCYNPTDHNVVATWMNTIDNKPYFSTYTEIEGWSTPSAIDNTILAIYDINCCYDPTSQKVFATWVGEDPFKPYFSSYSQNDGWSTPEIIVNNSTAYQVFCCADPATGEVLATWSDRSGQSINGYPYLSTYSSGTGWSQPIQLSMSLTQAGGPGSASIVFPSYDTSSNQVIITWPNIDSNAYYSVYSSSGSTSLPAIISLIPPFITSYVSIFSCYFPENNSTIATWINTDTQYPIYSFYQFSLTPPSWLSGNQKLNNFALMNELFNTLNWQANSNPNVTGFYLYRNNVLIAELPPTSTQYQDHNRPSGISTTYTLKSFDSSGDTSAPISITVKYSTF